MRAPLPQGRIEISHLLRGVEFVVSSFRSSLDSGIVEKQKKAVKEMAEMMRSLVAKVPIDPRTILKRCRITPDSANFHHFGLRNGIIARLKSGGFFDNSNCIQLMVNVDGIPISNSSSLSYWFAFLQISCLGLLRSDAKVFVSQ